jgi:hypothetical protein
VDQFGGSHCVLFDGFLGWSEYDKCSGATIFITKNEDAKRGAQMMKEAILSIRETEYQCAVTREATDTSAALKSVKKISSKNCNVRHSLAIAESIRHRQHYPEQRY